ncbi:hypothetical protein BV898_09821 [Hypsibius exemplaris]|uniref:Uncharacterized protein n=1 Tax=Hypsibius exemplaris TaxID=2072580 RepID=A0A1W0WLG1_HYPEX|nr:hypothetical protein BV898_09821 [Hypsibius exemplaris]
MFGNNGNNNMASSPQQQPLRKSLVKNAPNPNQQQQQQRQTLQQIPPLPLPSNHFYMDDGTSMYATPPLPKQNQQPTPQQIQAAQQMIANQQQRLQQLPPGQDPVSGGQLIPQASQSPQPGQYPQQLPLRSQQQQQQQQGYSQQQPNNLFVRVNNVQPLSAPAPQSPPPAASQQAPPPNQPMYSGPPMQMPAGQGPFYGPASNPMFGPATGTVQMETKNVTTTSITSVPLGKQPSEMSGTSDESKRTGDSGPSSGLTEVASRMTDTEVGLEITGDLPLWFKQDRKKFSRHMLHLFYTGVCAFVGKTHIYFVKVLAADQGLTPKHVKIIYTQAMFVKLEVQGGKKRKGEKKKSKKDTAGDHRRAEKNFEPNVTFYSHDEGEVQIKSKSKSEIHVLTDHFNIQKRQPQNCECKDPTVACKCFIEARRVILEDPSEYLRFTGTS